MESDLFANKLGQCNTSDWQWWEALANHNKSVIEGDIGGKHRG